jgi:Uma2 family endonuclease
MPATTRRWTVEDLESLPDDGNRYEVVRGRLFVTPASGPRHEMILERLASLLIPYVAAQELGHVYHRAVLRFEASEVEPDLSVRQEPLTMDTPWQAWPIPLLVVQVLSPTTRRRDFGDKSDLYADANVGEYWIVDGDIRRLHIIRGKDEVAVVDGEMRWQPAAASEPLVFAVEQLFS